MADHGLPAERRPELVPDFIKAIPPCEEGALALFDADGTLWCNDVADDFTTWMIDQGHVPGENWETYMRIYRDDHPAGCRYLLSFFEGMTLEELDGHVAGWWAEHAARNWVPEVVEVVYHLRDKGYPIWVLSGTPTDFLLPLKRILPVEVVVGMDFEVDGDLVITGKHEGISCAGEGKAEKLKSIVGQREVAFAAGNGSLDGPMMDLAQVPWSVYPNPEFEAYSRQKGWRVLPRPDDFQEEEKFLLEE